MNDEAQLSTAASERGRPRVLVTGGTGFVGTVAVRRLIADGYRVRVLARSRAKADSVAQSGAEVFWGDVADPVSFAQALEGCDMVVHLAAGTSGSEKDGETATLQGTRNLLDLCRRFQPKRLVYISSCSVYGVADYKRNDLIPETATLERYPERRGWYSAFKQQAEMSVMDYMKSGDVPVVILRPGTVYGPGGELFPAMMGFSIGSIYVVIGTGHVVLPFVHVENLAAAIGLCLQTSESEGRIFNVVDPGTLTKREYVDRVIRRVDRRARVLYVPYALINGITWLQEWISKCARRRPILTTYRLRSSQTSVVFDSRKIVTLLGWSPVRSLEEGLDGLVTFELSKRNGTAVIDGTQPSVVISRGDAEQLPAVQQSPR